MSKANGAEKGERQEEELVYHVNLDDIVNAKLSVTFGGKKYPVKPIDGAGFQILSRLNKNTNSVEATEIMYQLAATVLEGGELDVRSLTPAQVQEVVRLSANGARVVEGTAAPKNSGRPAVTPNNRRAKRR
jgi:hypothetical protein